MLHWWIAAAGQGEFAVRSLSAVTGVLIVALLYALARRLLGWQSGLFAAVAGAVSPLLVYYSQETRMYAQVTLFGLLSTYLLVRASEVPTTLTLTLSQRERGSRALWVAYTGAMVACLYSQYIGALVLVFQGLYVLTSRRKALQRFMAAAGAAMVAFAPWIAAAKDSLIGWPSSNAFQAGPQLFGDAAFRYVMGLSASFEPLPIALTAAGLLVAALGLRRSPLKPWLLAAGYVLVPLFVMFLLGYGKPLYNPKFALLALPGFLVLLGAGISAMGRLRWAGLALVLASAGFALNNYYANPRFARDNYRAVAEFIGASARAGDAIILDAPGQEQIFPYYFRGSPPLFGLPEDRPLNPDRTTVTLQRLNDQYKRLWLVLYGTNGSDPEGYVERWLAARDFETHNQWFGDVRLASFAVPSGQPPASRPADATIGGFAHLAGYTLTPSQVASGEVLQLGLKWQVQGPAPGNRKVFTHVIDAEGNIWAQRDSDPAGGARPTSSWKAGEAIDDNYGLLLLPGTPPGAYQAEIGMYDQATSARRLAVTAGGEGDRLLLGGIEVTRPEQQPSAAELQIPHPLEHSFGPIRLLGYGLALVGQDTERTSFAAGDEAHLTLFWQADATDGADAQLAVMLGQQALGSGALLSRHPTTTWVDGDRYRDQHLLRLPSMGGDFELAVRVNGAPLVALARVRIR